ncbi:thioredoxin family protein [Candidatus Uabimicrobium sp. HlEnr_7]|uniref:thioredoxin family protein n=1 Tax=Candidatus Uabimicrobium helgolandensis TaxID=3095367 RepID=UPI0035590995
MSWTRVFLRLIGILSALNGLWMLISSWSWYHHIPFEVWNIGPYNAHFIRDIAIIYIVQGVTFYWCANNLKKCRSVFIIMAMIVIAHGVLHIVDLILYRIPSSHWIVDISSIFIPAIYMSLLCIPHIWNGVVVHAEKIDRQKQEYVAMYVLLFTACLISLVYFYVATFHYKDHSVGKIEWYNDFYLAQQHASQKNMRLLVKVEAPVCINCNKLDSITFADRTINKLSDSFIWVKINRVENNALCRKLNITQCPTIVFYEPSGKEIVRVAGFLDSASFISLAEDIVK